MAVQAVNLEDDEEEDSKAKLPSLLEPESFTRARVLFGRRSRRDLAFFLEMYIQMCFEKNQSPVPQMLFLFQSKDKKNLLKRIKDKKACFYLPGNDPASRRRLTDADMNVICAFLLKAFPDHASAMDLRFNSMEDISALCQLMIKSNSVTELNLMFNNLTDYGVSSLRMAALTSNTLVSLCLSGAKFSSYGAFEIANLVGELSTLRYLNLSYCNLTIESIIAIMIPLRANTSKLEALDLTSPWVLDWTGRTVLIDHCARMLMSNTRLIELHLGKVQLDDFELDRLLIGLRRNSTLRYLDLNSNKLNRDGARLLMSYLIENQKLEVLDLDSNHFTDEGIEYLANGIFECRSLSTISLRYCAFGNLGLRYLTVGVQNSAVERLNLWQGTSLTGEGCEAFQTLVSTGRINQDNLDVKFYQVDGKWSMAETGQGGLRKWDASSPTFGEYSYSACYSGFVEPSPRAYWNPTK